LTKRTKDIIIIAGGQNEFSNIGCGYSKIRDTP